MVGPTANKYSNFILYSYLNISLLEEMMHIISHYFLLFPRIFNSTPGRAIQNDCDLEAPGLVNVS